MTEPTWRLLPLTKDGKHRPILLVKHDVGVSKYTIQVSDLMHIWTESLDRRQIIKRAFDEDTSIDPSEGSDQFRLLVRNVQKALDGEGDTRVDITQGTGSQDLALTVTAPLPLPLAPLIWPIHLSSASQDLLTSELILPCLKSLLSARSQVSSLLSRIKDKDHVIGRLSDKLQASGIELDAVFPSAVPSKGSKISSRESVLRSVNGLAEFDDREWRASALSSSDKTVGEICQNLFASDKKALPQVEWKPVGKWWLTNGNGDSASSDDEHAAIQPRLSPPRSIARDINEGDFQRQLMPGGLASPSRKHRERELVPQEPKRSSPIGRRESITSSSNDDLVAPATRSVRSHETKTQFESPKKKLGMIKAKTKMQSPAPKAKMSVVSGQYSDADNSDGEASKSDLNRAVETEPSPKPRVRLGKIGGLGGNTERGSSKGSGGKPQNTSSPVAQSSSVVVPQGHKTSSPAVELPERTGRPQSKLSAPPQPERETSQDRADRKRAELKRDLEQKEKAPTKKKRKF